MTVYVLDTNAIADLMRKLPQTFARFRSCMSRNDRLLLCPVVLYEVERGLQAQMEASTKRRAFEFLCGDLEYRELDRSVWLEAAALWASSRREGRPRTDNDLLLTAFARVHEATVVTRNIQDFEGLGVSVEDWRQPA